MTNCYMQEVECPECGKKNKITLWNTVNARLNPEIRDDLLNGKIHQYSCQACGNTSHLDKALEETQFLKFAINYVAGKRITNTETSSCILCKRDVKTGDKYIRIEVTEETSNDHVVKVKRAHTLGILCRDCAEKYLWGSVEGI